MNQDRMTPEALAEIRERAEKATPGAWTAMENGNTVPSHAVKRYALGYKPIVIASSISPKTGNADFIAHARDDVPALLAEVERQRTAEESLTVENARLRAELEAAKEDMHLYAQCVTCAHTYDGGMRCRVPLKERVTDGDRCHTWDWRGVPANTPAQGATDENGGKENG